MIIDGKKTREKLAVRLTGKIKDLPYVPRLAILQVGTREDSTAYIRAKNAFAKKIGVDVRPINLPETISQEEIIRHIQELNESKDVQGIIAQLPLPVGIDSHAVIESIDPLKDVDAITSTRVREWSAGKGILPATARGIHELLNEYDISLRGKKVTVVGRSALVGTPIAVMCANEGAEVTVCHSKTPDLVAEAKPADILIVAVGKPALINSSHVRPGQVVIDVGISRLTSERLVGDVDFLAVKDIVSAITPVPGGVGPMTVFGLFENLVDLCAFSLRP